MGAVLWVVRGQSIVLTVPLAAVAYVASLAVIGTFRQPDVALVVGLLPTQLRKRLPFVTGELDQAVPEG
jgi:hypothetical protein